MSVADERQGGAVGAVGPTGPTGATGATGPAGTPGYTGTATTIGATTGDAIVATPLANGDLWLLWFRASLQSTADDCGFFDIMASWKKAAGVLVQVGADVIRSSSLDAGIAAATVVTADDGAGNVVARLTGVGGKTIAMTLQGDRFQH